MTEAPFPSGYITELDKLLYELEELKHTHFDINFFIVAQRELVTAFVRKWGRPLQVYGMLPT